MFAYFEWLLLAFPLSGACTNAFLGRRLGRRAQTWVATGAPHRLPVHAHPTGDESGPSARTGGTSSGYPVVQGLGWRQVPGRALGAARRHLVSLCGIDHCRFGVCSGHILGSAPACHRLSTSSVGSAGRGSCCPLAGGVGRQPHVSAVGLGPQWMVHVCGRLGAAGRLPVACSGRPLLSDGFRRAVPVLSPGCCLRPAT